MPGHISTLEEAGYLVVKKFFRGKAPATSLKITLAGRSALKKYHEQLNRALQGQA
ncbi:MAG TPA: transcriptional regulator [Terriglobia bacterium]|nr:transcriptional regulator [Terriglobia bacterium]